MLIACLLYNDGTFFDGICITHGDAAVSVRKSNTTEVLSNILNAFEHLWGRGLVHSSRSAPDALYMAGMRLKAREMHSHFIPNLRFACALFAVA